MLPKGPPTPALASDDGWSAIDPHARRAEPVDHDGSGVSVVLSSLAVPALALVPWAPWVAGLIGTIGLVLLLATLVAWRGRVVLGPHRRGDRRPALGPAMVVLAVACGAFIFDAMRPVVWTGAITPLAVGAGLFGCLVLFLLVGLEREAMDDDASRLAAAVGGFVWGAAVLLQANALLPQALRVLSPVQVVDMQDWSTRHGHHYELYIGRADWRDVGIVPVSGGLYDRVEPGACVLMINERGRLGVWRRRFTLCTPEAESRLPRVTSPGAPWPSPRTSGSP